MAKQVATATATATATAPAVAAAPQVIVSVTAPAKPFRGNSARSRTFALLQAHQGKTVAAFSAAWQAQHKQLLGPNAKFVNGTAKAAETAQGWLNWFKAHGMCVVK